MREGILHTILILTLVCCGPLRAQADSVDVQHYDITLDLSEEAPFHGDATVTMKLLRPLTYVKLQLYGTADSIWVDGVRQSDEVTLMRIPVAGIEAGTEFTVRVCYTGSGFVENSGYGGFHFDGDMSYNLAVGFDVNPHVLGRATMPCRDNLTDKATYSITVMAKPGWTAECSGILTARDTNDDNIETSHWSIEQPTPTYIVGISQAAWKRMQRTVVSGDHSYPLTVGYTYQNVDNVTSAFVELDSVVPMFERCFGPYRWGRIGYVATRKGSMEHAQNIALDRSLVASTAERAQTTIAHELGHAWFGNLVTCADYTDMWFNEGGASFTSEVAMESVKGREASDDYYQRNLESVIRTTHITDGAYRALHGVTHDYTYGATTYNKGWMVWHSLRGYLGDSVFYASLRRLMDEKAFGNVTADEVRDLMGSYSNTDLTAFFDFHVFNRGFVDYHAAIVERDIDNPNRVRVRLQQQTIGVITTVAGNRVPVTFFAADGRMEKVWFHFDGESHDEWVTLPFEPQFCVLDNDKEISDAATIGSIDLEQLGTQVLNIEHMRFAADSVQPGRIFVEHHWGKPHDIYGTGGIVRTIQRYWVVQGDTAAGPQRATFRYVVGDGSSYPNLDKGVITKTATEDSLVLLWRPNSTSPWYVVSRTRVGTTGDRYIQTDHLYTGEYTIGVADLNSVGLSTADATADGLSTSPNPVAQGAPLTITAPTSQPFRLSVYDATGRRVWSLRQCHSGQQVSLDLPHGIYTIATENKEISISKQIIIL